MATATAKPAAREKRVRKDITPKVTETKKPTPAKAVAKPARREKRITPAEAHAKVAAKKAVGKKAPAEKKVAPTTDTKRATAGDLYVGNLVLTIDFLNEMGPEVSDLMVDAIVKPLWKGTELAKIDKARTNAVVMGKRYASRIKGTGDPALDGKTLKLEAADLALIYEHKGNEGGCTLISLMPDSKPVAAVFDARSRKRLTYTEVPKDEDKFSDYLTVLVESANKLGAGIAFAD